MTISITRSIDIDADASTVWAILADYAHDQRWRRGVISMTSTPSGVVDVGTTTHEVIRVAGTTRTNLGVVTSVEPGHRFRWQTTSGVTACGSRTVSPAADGRCTVTLELRVTPTGLDRLIAPVAARLLGRNLRADCRALRSLAAYADTGATLVVAECGGE